MKRSLLLALVMCAGSPAIAGQTPTAGAKDARMRTVMYDPKQVVRLTTTIGGALVVGFSPDEKVTAVAASDSKDLVAMPRENFLFMKPKSALPPQPVIVLTSGPNGVRRYVFQVEATTTLAAGAQAGSYYSVDFIYSPQRSPVEAARREQRAAVRELARDRDGAGAPARTPQAAVKNWRYVARGNRALTPLEVFDNGFSTSFRFPGNIRIPSIYRINPDGKEATVNYAVRGDYVVVSSVAPGWRLRDGKAVLDVWNRAFDPIGRSPGTSTTSPRVKRITKDSPR